jgi:hypothetical protein
MIQQVLNKQLLQDVLDSMQALAQASVEDERRAVTGTPMDEMGPAERAELLQSIETAKKRAAEGDEEASDRRGESAELSLADRNTYISRSPELSNLQSAIEQYFLEQRSEAVESLQADDRRGGAAPVAGSVFVGSILGAGGCRQKSDRRTG